MPLLALLRDQTATCHQELETALAMDRVGSRDDYRRLLGRFYTLYEPLEARLAAAMDWPAAGWDFEGRRKADWLRLDLASLGIPAAELAAWPRCGDLPPLGSPAAALGCLYVVEGSTLGGQFLTRLFGRTLGLTPAEGARFFHGYGAQTRGSWQAFEQWTARQGDAGELLVEAGPAARATFGCFSRWLTR